MRISFDLDDLLIGNAFGPERTGFLSKIFSAEKLRAGTKELFRRLHSADHEIYIYTTSLRSKGKIRRTFFCHGISPDGIINKTQHDLKMQAMKFSCSKFPPAFGIDVHIDDSEGVRQEGERYHFRTIIISPADPDWAAKILQELNA